MYIVYMYIYDYIYDYIFIYILLYIYLTMYKYTLLLSFSLLSRLCGYGQEGYPQLELFPG